jgi:hypothetical protein
MVLKKQGKNSMQTGELIGPWDCHGHPQDYGVILIQYLYDSLLDDYSFPVKKPQTISHLFYRVVDIRGHKDNMCAAKKTPNEIWCMVSRDNIKFPTFTKYQKTQK